MRTLALSLVFLALPASAAAQPDACDGVACSEHGGCMLEREEPFCLCDEGYAAAGLSCEPAPEAMIDPAALRSASLGARIVRLAVSEGGRRMGQVGQDRTTYPGRLIEHIKVGALWCTDFVSWVYRAAGIPFTGGYDGGWHITNNYAVRAWFQRQDRWVGRESREWAHFTPQPGDYLRFHTSTHGHSAIVRYVAGDTLYTIEGNSRGLVRLRHYARYRERRRIDGFGIVTRPGRRRAWLRRLSATRARPRAPAPAVPRRRRRPLEDSSSGARLSAPG